MENDKFNDCYKKVLLFNLIASLVFSVLFFYLISVFWDFSYPIWVSVKLILWLLRDRFNLDETNDNTG